MNKAFEFRIYPDEDQKILIAKTFGCKRVVYNKALELQNSSDKTISFPEMNKELTCWKNSPDTIWLKEPDKNALQYSIKDFIQAQKNHRDNPSHFKSPKFKKRKNKQSYRTANTVNKKTGGNAIEVFEDCIKLPKLGKVKAVIHRPIEGRIINATIKQMASGKYFCSICCTDVFVEPLKKLSNAIGLDVGVKSFAVDSNGVEYENKHFYKSCEKKIKREQRILSRRTKGSKRWNRQRKKLAKIHEEIYNRREDYLHKITSRLINENQIICLEDINVKGLLKNHKLAKSISECGWYRFKVMLQYKALRYGRKVIIIDRFYPSSRLCNNCGWKNTDLELQDRKWHCPCCGMELERDINAAENVRDEGLRTLEISHSQAGTV